MHCCWVLGDKPTLSPHIQTNLEDRLFLNTQYSKGLDFILVWQSARLGMTSLSNFSSFKTVWRWKHFNPFQNPSIATSCPTVPPISALFLAWNHWLLMLVLRNWLIQNLYRWPPSSPASWISLRARTSQRLSALDPIPRSFALCKANIDRPWTLFAENRWLVEELLS